MAGLLVSVRSQDEALAALAGGADLIDVKEPRRGALGAADATVWRAVSSALRQRAPVSVALGELLDFAPPPADDLARNLTGVQFAKLGLAGCRDTDDWLERWRLCVNRLPEDLAPVAVVYADWRAARAPAPEDVIDQASRLQCGAVLFDTCDKSRGDLIDHFGIEQLDRMSELIRNRGMRIVFGGSLNRRSAARLLPLRPDYIAVRGAVCREARTDCIDRQLVESLARVVHAD
jgi:uncharacterized protein (UPF0264 family)